MKRNFFYLTLILFSLFSCNNNDELKRVFKKPPESAKPWVYWYWRNATVSKEGIYADLKSFKDAGIAGAYIFTIQGAEDPPLFDPPAEQLTPYWWELINYSFKIADSLGLKLGMHACDGFTVAGGPWITPEKSMQKIGWSKSYVTGGKYIFDTLPQPETIQNYYEDIAVFAIPSSPELEASTRTIIPKIFTSIPDIDPEFLVKPDGKTRLVSNDSCWIIYEFQQPFTCRSVLIHTNGNNLQSHRLTIEASQDGKNYIGIDTLKPPRHGWQDYDAPVTHSVNPYSAKFYRFKWNLKGTEPASEDFDNAKWKQRLKLVGLELFSQPVIHQFEGKSGVIWRISEPSVSEKIPDSLCIPQNKILDLTSKIDSNGLISWDAPEGNWMILRIGHTTTGHTNYIGGAAVGLECDKFNPEVVRFQFDNWFGRMFKNTDPKVAARVLKIFHVDSWEAGSQNWSPVFREEFLKRRGYDLFQYLPVMAGIPVESSDVSEGYLHDVRQTINELVNDHFFGTIADLARKKGCVFSAESMAPTFTSDNMMHFNVVDIPMGEFWHNSPTHDKPNDMLDAISAAHIYGKKIIQSESFTTLRMEWDEYPGILKPLLDRNYALGMNRIVFHVTTLNPWMDKKPGMTLDGVGLYFQRDQTWWDQSTEWLRYMDRCQALLQQGRPVVDIAVFTGEELPRRALTPDRLVDIVPGLFDKHMLIKEKERQANTGIPYQEKPVGVTNTTNVFKPADWIDPLNGYQYDSFNKDAFLSLASVENGKIVLPGGARYALLIIPGTRKMAPNGKTMSLEVAEKISSLLHDGAIIMIQEKPVKTPGLQNIFSNNEKLNTLMDELYNHPSTTLSSGLEIRKVGPGTLITGTFRENSLDLINIERDLIFKNPDSVLVENFAWNHRQDKNFDIYFISNQEDNNRKVTISSRITNRLPEIFYPVSGMTKEAEVWKTVGERTEVTMNFDKNESLFLIFQKKTSSNGSEEQYYEECRKSMVIDDKWNVSFDTSYGGPGQVQVFDQLFSWTEHPDPRVKYYSGTAVYRNSFNINSDEIKEEFFIQLDKIENIARVIVNEKDCGVIWTPPYQLNITQAIQPDENKIEILVSNTWRNRLIGDHSLPESERITQTTAPYRLENKPLTESGIMGNVTIKMK